MRVGVTGIFASGKGTVCGMFEELGARVVDTDIIAREVVEPGQKGLQRIVDEFGDDFLKSDGSLDRIKFALHIFIDKKKVDILNKITHPIILEIVLKRSDTSEIYMINTPLLFESGYDTYMDKNITVTADIKQVYDRGIRRDGIGYEEINDRLEHQIPLNEKIKLADYIIDNSGSMENTKRQVLKLWKILKNTKKP